MDHKIHLIAYLLLVYYTFLLMIQIKTKKSMKIYH
ncbi:unknown [Prevotella sp. CAG:891]|nr:unknown [Prevotella sp. CAG:891]